MANSSFRVSSFTDSRLALFEELHETNRRVINLGRKLFPALRENSKFQKLQNYGELVIYLS